VFVGRRYQYGHGLGQVIGGLFKCFVVPLVVPHAKQIEKQVGRGAKEAIKERGLSGIKRTVGEIVRQSPLNFGTIMHILHFGNDDDDDAPKTVKRQQQQQEKNKKKKTFGARDIFA